MPSPPPNLLTGNPTNFPAQVRAPGTGQPADLGTFGAGLQDVADRTSHTDARVGYPTESGQSAVAHQDVSGIWFWVPKRQWINIQGDVDPTGAIGCASVVTAKLNSKKGCCVYTPDDHILNLDAPIVQPEGTAFVGGNELGMINGSYVFSGSHQVGTRLLITHTGSGFVPAQQTRICDFEIFYPNQRTKLTGGQTPIPCGPTFDLDGTLQCTIQNIACVNPYFLLKQHNNSAALRLDNVTAYPLSRGIVLNRVPGPTRITNVDFNPAIFASGDGYAGGDGSMLAYTQSFMAAYIFDGAEAFMCTNCFVQDAAIGAWAIDDDGDGFFGCTGGWVGGGFDFVHRAILVDATNKLSLSGLQFVNIGIAGDGAGSIGVLFSDTHVPLGPNDRPSVWLTNFNIGNVGCGIQMQSGSYGVASATNGVIQALSGGAITTRDGTNSVLDLDHVKYNLPIPLATGNGSGGVRAHLCLGL